ncbi:MAG: flagellar biosynthesis protein FlhA [Candidatus Aquicultor secundus]|nr:flagellar biosynthesis protein FlhA [Solirubrobacter sp.]PIW22986.1 MAG: flagellar biosynthesis protein FlhA [Candidatus Aquicultor secundus]PIX51883.1 MAG: flagellar biosynthesis protein FlhA [Candidatus Aquicultor secundus]PJB78258.1 MAG: flagellar biosynthesis protein FlhA [Candidatus Aquicultor secundus]
MATDQAVTTSRLIQFNKYSDAILALIIALIVSLLIIPIPTALIDGLLVFNLILSIVVLLVTMYNNEPLQFSMFPSLLLVTTLFRLGLYISTTRAILSTGAAGSVVNSFGSIIIGDNFVVGIVIFIILVIVQFIVITTGTARISEVTARFTLDAMPGKQMAIDADLNSGLITEDEAKTRRRNVQREADFYGAMDGASKFVKGDATASIIIAAVNLIGGFIVGATQQNMDLMTSLQTFGRIAIGAGLAIQIPTLLISTAAGIIVTRVASDSDLGQDLSKQLFTQPRALMITGILIIFFGMIPGLPKLPFFIMGGLTGGASYFINQSSRRAAIAEEELEVKEEAPAVSDNLIDVLQIDPMELEIGYSLIPLVDPDQGGEILDRITLMRRQIALDLGYVVPPIRIRDNIQIAPSEYRIKIKGSDIARSSVFLDQLLAIDSGMTVATIDGTETREPAFGLTAYWISPERREEAEVMGYTVVDPTSAMITHLSEITKKYAHELISRQDVQQLLDNIKQSYPVVVEEVVPGVLTVGEIQQVLQGLLAERVSIRDMTTLLEALGDSARNTRNIDILTEYARQAIGRSICHQHQSEDGKLDVIAVDPLIEKEIVDSVEYTDQGIVISLDPARTQQILESLSNTLEEVLRQGRSPVILCSTNIRRPLRKIAERKLPNLAVLSYNEIAPEFELQSVGMVSLV